MKTIFFVEDDEALQDIALLVFTPPDFVVRVFCSAEDLLAEKSHPDVYVLDKQLPRMDGLTLCRLLKQGQLTKDIPVVVVSAAPDIKVLAADAGADGSLEKPFSIHELVAVVERVHT